jgi:hypothetical protein
MTEDEPGGAGARFPMRKAEQIRRWQLGISLPLFTVGMALAANLIVHRLYSIYTLLFFIFAISITAAVGKRLWSWCRRSFCPVGPLFPG